MGELLALRGVCKGYMRGERTMRVLTNASLELAAGEVVAVVGSRSEGKTTLLKIAAGIETPDAGEVWLGNMDLARCGEQERTRLLGAEIAWAHREGTGVKFRVLDYVGLPLAIGRGHGHREARDLAMETLERVGAAGCAEQRWADLSNWERLLVGFARGIACSPRLLVVDDLMDGFGMRRTREAGELLLTLVAERGCGVLMSSCDLEAALIADRVWSLERGRLTKLSEPTKGLADVIDFPSGVRQQHSSRGVGG
ncbi:MAG TPA: ATP-binding cassette domain-containing protein [Solirubrobacteraceae bacterium]|jgi:predicted ABC-type transport system involved in lysophospholipase L1 biosynthesis ATPase subunit|nr:ATP-binding cassette domain-containing protein [Solirubrobacteraceae bacterium]